MASLQLSNDVSLSAYYQFEWRKDRLPGSGSYFSIFDYLDEGGERFIVGPGHYLLRRADQRPSGGGQSGIALQFAAADFNWGLYALQFNAKESEVYLRPSNAPSGANFGTYNLVYPQAIALYGASFSGYLGSLNLAGELSLRTRMPLVSNPITVPGGDLADNRSHPLYPLGDTLHAQVSTVDTLSRGSFWDSADLGIEFSANDRLA